MCSAKASCLLDVSAVMEKSLRVGRPPPFLVPSAVPLFGVDPLDRLGAGKLALAPL
jgi:hypothetical protein